MVYIHTSAIMRRYLLFKKVQFHMEATRAHNVCPCNFFASNPVFSVSYLRYNAEVFFVFFYSA